MKGIESIDSNDPIEVPMRPNAKWIRLTLFSLIILTLPLQTSLGFAAARKRGKPIATTGLDSQFLTAPLLEPKQFELPDWSKFPAIYGDHFDPQPPKTAQINLIEFESFKKNGRPSTLYETIRVLKAQYAEFALVISSDTFEKMENKGHFPEVLKFCHWVILERKSDDRGIIAKTLQKWINKTLIDFTLDQDIWSIQGTSYFLRILPSEDSELISTQEQKPS
jgi:hypothetical protein